MKRLSFALGLFALVGLAISCSGSSGCGGGDKTRAKEEKEAPLVAGRVLMKDPLWIGVEGGKQGKIYVNATDAQLAKLRAKYKSIVLFPPNVLHERQYGFEFDLVDPKQERPCAFKMLAAEGGDMAAEELFPISIVGITSDGKEEGVGHASAYRRPLLEDLLAEPCVVRFSRYPRHTVLSGGMARVLDKGESDRWNAALEAALPEGDPARLGQRFASLEIRVSGLPTTFILSMENLRTGTVRQYSSGDPLSEDLDVSVSSIMGIAQDGKRELVYPTHKK